MKWWDDWKAKNLPNSQEETSPTSIGGINEALDRLRNPDPQEEREKEAERLRLQKQWEQEYSQRDLKPLATLLKYSFGYGGKVDRNPIQIDGLWFGVSDFEYKEDNGADYTGWRLHLYVPCKQCGYLYPVLSLSSDGYSLISELHEDASKAVAERILHIERGGWTGPPCPKCGAMLR